MKLKRSLAPTLLILTLLLGASLLYGLMQSLGYLTIIGEKELSLTAYQNLISGQGTAGREFWASLGFSLWVSIVSTILSAIGALFLATLLNRRPSNFDTFALNWNLAFPHLVWGVFMLLLLAQSGLLARWAGALGIIQSPADFPVLVRDRYGIGIILTYLGKEIPFLTLLILALLRTQSDGYLLVAQNLGANAWQRFRLVTLPLVRPALVSGSLLVFAYIFGAYEVPALLGVRYPRTLPVLALESFTNPDLRARAEGMAISLIIAFIVLMIAGFARAKEELQG
ncbi:MAG: ABC transporter permease subunit [Anaerolineae bacterium]|nr:ABC transporter permease subunit [Anaerolineae bacterium]MBT7070918.1 ABC transporter permease subunit [Anaerolineae bacterium]MBT7991620.1 ABC transporter permease subunit [Anaerolineae bacterium]